MSDRATITTAVERARAYLLLAAALGQQGLVGAEEQTAWEKRSAWTRGIEYGRLYVLDALRIAGTTTDTLPDDMQTALRVLDEFVANQPNTLRPIPPERIEAVTTAAQAVGIGLRAAIDRLPTPE